MDPQNPHTCTTCSVAFKDGALQREHYKSDWHRYNLKRKVAEMPPITLEVFQEKMDKHQEKMKALSGEVEEPTGYCVCCRKSFNNQKAYDNHLNSKKHKQIESKFEKRDNKMEIANNRLNKRPSESRTDDVVDESDGEEVEEVDSDEWDEEEFEGGEAVPNTDCIFCSHHSRDVEKNVVHLTEKHSFFIPDADYLVDLEGLLTYLGEKVGQGYLCLWCNVKSKAFQSLPAVQKHMLDKGHCRLRHDGNAFLEYSRFYDYSTSYPDQGEKDDAMEDDDDEVQVDEIDDSGYELVLPSGARIGHRSLMKYYKQSLNPDRQIQVRKTNNKLLHHYKALGWTGLSASEAKTKARDLSFMRRAQQKHFTKLGTVGNYTLRHRFRDANM